MASKEPYIIIPRSIFTGEAWKSASLEQKGAMADLCVRAAYCEFDYDSHLGNVHIEKNQILTSYSKLAECWRIGIGKVRSIVNYWKNSKLIKTTVVSMSPSAQQSAQFLARCTLLTVNALDDSAAQCSAQQSAQEKIKKKKIKKKNTPIPPTGADSSSDFSPDFPSEEVERCKAEADELNMKLSAAWQKIMEEKIWPNEYYQYMPYRRGGLCNRDYIKQDLQIPAIRTLDQRQAFYFIEYHLCDFIKSKSFRHTLSSQDIDNITSQLLSHSADLTIAQLPLFFHLLDRDDRIVGPPEWNGILTTDLITTAFRKYLEWLKK